MSEWSDFDLSRLARELVPVLWWTTLFILGGIAVGELYAWSL